MKLKRRQTLITVSIIAGLAIIGIAVTVAAMRHGQKTASTTATKVQQDGPGKDTTVHAGPATDTTLSESTATTTNPDHPASSTLSTPTGQFLNKHSISLSSTNNASSPVMESTCQSDPGTSCGFEISLSGHATVVLGPQTVDATTDGAIYEWNAAAKGLTPGNWSVRAFAQKAGAATVYSSSTTLKVAS